MCMKFSGKVAAHVCCLHVLAQKVHRYVLQFPYAEQFLNFDQKLGKSCRGRLWGLP